MDLGDIGSGGARESRRLTYGLEGQPTASFIPSTARNRIGLLTEGSFRFANATKSNDILQQIISACRHPVPH